MSQHEPDFDESLRSALKRSTLSLGASAPLRAKVSAMLRAGAPAVPVQPVKTQPKLNDPRVFGLPRVWGLAAAIALLLLGGSLITYQLTEFFPRRQSVAHVDSMKLVIDGMVAIHQQTADTSRLSADLPDFHRKLPTAMPLATLGEGKGTFVGAMVTQLNGQLCYAMKYLVDNQPLTLITANARVGYDIPTYNQTEGALRLVGGEKEGFLVCLVGDKTVAGPRYQGLLATVKMLPSPSTQPVTSATETCAATR